MSSIGGPREATLLSALELLLEARRTCKPLGDLPEGLQPVSQDEAYFVQDRMAEAYGPVGGWKVGAATPETTPIFAPMPAAWIAATGTALTGNRYRGLEAEIAFLVGSDLPPRSIPYSRDEVLSAMASCHPAIEVLESAFIDPTQAAKFAAAADLQMHGGFVYGPAFAGWRDVDFAHETVVLSVDGVVRVERTGSNTSGDLLGLLVWLANEGAARTGGLRDGQWITTGSWTGNIQAIQGSRVLATFGTVGSVELCFD